MIRRRFFSSAEPALVSWSESALLVEKKSKFQGRCTKITSPQQVPELIEDLLKSEKSLLKASHPVMYAWRLGTLTSFTSKNEPKFDFLNQSSHDNGEGGSGARLLGLLERSKLVNVLVVVSRWYGGVPLGPLRFRAISQVAVESLKIGGFLDTKGQAVYDLRQKGEKRNK